MRSVPQRPLAGMAVLRWAALAGGVAVTWLGGSALIATLHSNDMEGYILVIAALLIVQAVLTWRALLRRGPAVA